jgi:hypothetical protein
VQSSIMIVKSGLDLYFGLESAIFIFTNFIRRFFFN